MAELLLDLRPQVLVQILRRHELVQLLRTHPTIICTTSPMWACQGLVVHKDPYKDPCDCHHVRALPSTKARNGPQRPAPRLLAKVVAPPNVRTVAPGCCKDWLLRGRTCELLRISALAIDSLMASPPRLPEITPKMAAPHSSLQKSTEERARVMRPRLCCRSGTPPAPRPGAKWAVRRTKASGGAERALCCVLVLCVSTTHKTMDCVAL